jgi:protein-S-isoprenylcysteine O-methyltransferase Ste14
MDAMDIPAMQFVLVLTLNLIIGFFDRTHNPVIRPAGVILILMSCAMFLYTVSYLRGGFFGETEPVLNYLITDGPYRFCRHPLYLSFIILLFGFGLYLGNWISLIYTAILSIPSAAYRARKEDEYLGSRFGAQWRLYSSNVGMFFPKIRKKNLN